MADVKQANGGREVPLESESGGAGGPGNEGIRGTVNGGTPSRGNGSEGSESSGTGRESGPAPAGRKPGDLGGYVPRGDGIDCIAITAIPGAGKSPRARAIAHRWGIDNGKAIIVSDPAHVWTWADVPHYTAKEGVDRAFNGKESVALGTQDPAVIGAVCKKAADHGSVILVFDELRYFGSVHNAIRDLVILSRTFRHRRVGLIFVTQRINDIHSDIMSCVTEVHVGRVIAPRALDYLAKEFSFNPESLRKLPENVFEVHREGF